VVLSKQDDLDIFQNLGNIRVDLLLKKPIPPRFISRAKRGTICLSPLLPIAASLLPENLSLKGPKREMFVAGIFTEIRPVWVGELESWPKNLKSLCLGPYITLYFLGFLL
jgi:hypothetical protein